MRGRGWRLGVVLAGLMTASAPAVAQPFARPARIGFLPSSSVQAANLDAFRAGLSELGYAEGRDVIIEVRDAKGRVERLPDLAAELVGTRVDLIVTSGSYALRAASGATKAIPIVVAYTGDLVGTGLVASLSRPGGNITGVTGMAPEIEGKRLQLLREMSPRLDRVVVLWSSPRSRDLKWPAIEDAARSLGVRVQSAEVRTPGDLDRVFAGTRPDRGDALLVLLDNFTTGHRTQITALAARHRLPAVYEERAFVEAGGLISYGPRIADMYRRAAGYVDRILRGARPGDLPVEQPTRFELIVNLKTARVLGTTVPGSVLLRADQVLE